MLRTFYLLLICLMATHHVARANQILIGKHDDGDTLIQCEIVLKHAYSLLGMSPNIISLPGKRALQEANAGNTDAELCRIIGMSKEYPNLIQVEPALHTISIVAVTINPTFKFTSTDDLKDFSLGSIQGMKAAEIHFNDFDISYVNNYMQVIKLLNEGLIDFAVLPLNDVLLAINKTGQQNLIIHQPPLFTHQLFHYVHKSHIQLVPKLQDAITKTKKSLKSN